jgi:hypothetical protein
MRRRTAVWRSPSRLRVNFPASCRDVETGAPYRLREGRRRVKAAVTPPAVKRQRLPRDWTWAI